MSVSQVCINARAALAEIYSLKDAFDSAFKTAIESGSAKDIAACDQLKQSLIQKIEQLELDIAPDDYKKQLINLKILERKQAAGESFTRDDLLLIYEVNSTIDRSQEEDRVDERITELRSSRDLEKDTPIIFECTPGQIARAVDQITEHTRAYVGPLEKDIFNHLPDSADYIYTKFPETRIRKQSLEIGGKTKEELTQLLGSKGFSINGTVFFMMASDDFTVLKDPEELKLIRLTVAQLGFINGATTEQIIFARAAELGLELCPAEVGPYCRLRYTDQPTGDLFVVGMKPISDQDGYQSVFNVWRNENSSFLGYDWAEPDRWWDAAIEFIFRLRKKN